MQSPGTEPEEGVNSPAKRELRFPTPMKFGDLI